MPDLSGLHDGGSVKKTKIGRVDMIEPGHDISLFFKGVGSSLTLAQAANAP